MHHLYTNTTLVKSLGSIRFQFSILGSNVTHLLSTQTHSSHKENRSNWFCCGTEIGTEKNHKILMVSVQTTGILVPW